MTVEELARGIKKGKRRHLAKAITLTESSRSEDQEEALRLLELLNGNYNTIRVGISGVPGVGKVPL